MGFWISKSDSQMLGQFLSELTIEELKKDSDLKKLDLFGALMDAEEVVEDVNQGFFLHTF